MNKNRIWEIDLLRGIAFLCMVYDHAIYDVNYIFGYKTDFLWGYDYIIGDTSAFVFMVLCGISIYLSADPFKNGLKVFGVACCLTVVTGMIDRFFSLGIIINFGILHLLGISMMIGAIIKKLHPAIILPLSALVVFFKDIIRIFADVKPSYWLFPIGFTTGGFYSSDYYPILPYLGIVLLGVFIGKVFYKKKKSLFPFSISGKDPFSFIGKHSLLLYVTHQPLLLIIVYAVLTVLSSLELI